jgi:hypothetical protein
VLPPLRVRLGHLSWNNSGGSATAGPRFKLGRASRPPRGSIRRLGSRGGGRERGWPWWLPSGGSSGSRGGRQSYGRARGSYRGGNGDDGRALGWAFVTPGF